MTGAVAREISYAVGVRNRTGQLLVRSIENVTGRPSLIRRAEGYDAEVAAGANFWEVICRRYGIELDLPGAGLGVVPREGPMVMISNHPYGILDGLAMGRILSEARGDFRIIANNVFRKADDINRIILPISFEGTKEAQRVNIETRREALGYLGRGGAIGVFPGGTVSTARKPFGQAMDPPWKTFTAKMIAKSKAAVVPVYFEGSNSRRFQIASHLHPTLRLALLINEFKTRVGGKVRAVIGAPLPADEIAARRGDSRALMDYLRESTYRLSPTPLKDYGYGYDFEE
jgi:putative hemolysin